MWLQTAYFYTHLSLYGKPQGHKHVAVTPPSFLLLVELTRNEEFYVYFKNFKCSEFSWLDGLTAASGVAV